MALFESQVAADDYNLTQQQNSCELAMSRLKEEMNLPADTLLSLDSTSIQLPHLTIEDADAIYSFARHHNPLSLQADYELKNSRY